LGLFAELLLYVDDETLTKLEQQLQQSEIDFDFEAKRHLIQVITDVEKTDILPVKDNYAVSVQLKDDSVYAYAPSRFAHSERLELRKITDDLLARGLLSRFAVLRVSSTY